MGLISNHEYSGKTTRGHCRGCGETTCRIEVEVATDVEAVDDCGCSSGATMDVMVELLAVGSEQSRRSRRSSDEGRERDIAGIQKRRGVLERFCTCSLYLHVP